MAHEENEKREESLRVFSQAASTYDQMAAAVKKPDGFHRVNRALFAFGTKQAS